MNDLEPRQGSALRRAMRQLTPARVGLEQTGNSLSTAEQLAFQLDHARARDAVRSVLDLGRLASGLEALGLTPLVLESAAAAEVPAVAGSRTRDFYLRRPDLGRILSPASAQIVGLFAAQQTRAEDLVIVVADGLSAAAIERNAVALLTALLPSLQLGGWRTPVVAIVKDGRVAVGDQIGHLLGARLTILLIGERPGLSAPDSLGVYLTWSPRPGRSDAERNCISNIRHGGLGFDEAAARIAWLAKEAQRLQATGFQLKETETLRLEG